MLDVGWPELLVIAIVLIVVVGPKDLPKMLRTFGRTTSKLRAMAGDFRRQFDDALREAELDDLKSLADTARSMNPTNEIRKSLNPLNKIGDEIKGSLDDATKPRSNEPVKGTAKAEPSTHPAEPAKTGATAVPGEGTLETTPSAKTEGDGEKTGKGA
ncbi:twin-arginine translocase subunit TatB [Zhengella mangrovi]|uniref:Sec-independent protein translocase protein TatB n=1 Tax=Zhengella mangrovi TaxID=1982044 RepID=A0A2G1QR05_9HYPH|nr:Sec-independent protein translocase protein TatB [Zhengella mangrovi]PHP67977.1 twin-arginine translocase subunit TatB [Zhengella mangrovi]